MFDLELNNELFFRLPTEAEWEKAARGIDGRKFPWGDKFNRDKCNTSKGRHFFYSLMNKTESVYKYSPQGDSPYACADMVGNVWEWTSSMFQPYPYSADDGREDGTVPGYRVIRGSAYFNDGDDFISPCTIRHKFSRDHVDVGNGVGFRVVLAPKLPS